MQSSSPHTQLLNTLPVDSGYNPVVPPRIHVNQTITVGVLLSLLQIIDINEKSQYLQVVASLNMRWRDEFLVWDPSQFHGLSRIYIPAEKLWVPDVSLFNSVEGVRSSFHDSAHREAEVSHTGEISRMVPVLLKSSCVIQVSMYPFDEQTCSVEFMSWVHTVREINLTSVSDQVVVSAFKVNPQWILLNTSCDRSELLYPCCTDPFSAITCHMMMLRRPLFYIYNFAFPCFLLMVIGGLVFRVPPESGEKISLAVTVLLANTVYMMVVMNNVPENSQVVPLLQKFIGTTVVLLTLSTILSVCLVKCQYQNSQRNRPPYWIRVLVLEWIAPLVLMRSHKQTRPASLRAHTGDKGKYEQPMSVLESPNMQSRDLSERSRVRSHDTNTNQSSYSMLDPSLDVTSSHISTTEPAANDNEEQQQQQQQQQQQPQQQQQQPNNAAVRSVEQLMLIELRQQTSLLRATIGQNTSRVDDTRRRSCGADNDESDSDEHCCCCADSSRCRSTDHERCSSSGQPVRCRSDQVYNEWCAVTIVLDRFCFALYFIAVAVVLCLFSGAVLLYREAWYAREQ